MTLPPKKAKVTVTVFKLRWCSAVLRSGATGGPDEALPGAQPPAGAEDQAMEPRLPCRSRYTERERERERESGRERELIYDCCGLRRKEAWMQDVNDLKVQKQQDMEVKLSVRRHDKCVCECRCVCVKGELFFPFLPVLIFADSLAAEVRMSRNVFLVSHRDGMALHISAPVSTQYQITPVGGCFQIMEVGINDTEMISGVSPPFEIFKALKIRP